MTNRDLDAARDYHEATKHSYESLRSVPHFLDWENQPLPFKLYRDREPMPLPKELPDIGIPALEALDSEERAGTAVPGREALARLLYFSAGVTKARTYPGGQILFRAASCTGALYHIELYLVCGHLPDVDAAVYHFGPSDFALRVLRQGDWRRTLVEASGGEPSVAAAPAMVVLTSTYWRNAWKYRSRAYRHAFWDSGTLLANLLAMANALHLPARLVLGFGDDTVNGLLGVDPDREAALCIVALGRRSEGVPAPPGPMTPLELETVPLSRSEVVYPAIRHMHSASSLDSGELAAQWREGPGPRLEIPEIGESLHPLAPGEALPDVSLETVIRKRGSTRRFGRTSITFEQLSTILSAGTAPLPADFLLPDQAWLNELYVLVNDVKGLPPGAYYYHRDRKALEELAQGDFRAAARHLDLDQELAGDASVNVYSLVSLEPVLERFGNRGYRAAQLEGGVIGGKIYLASYALGLGATGLTFYDDDVTEFFSPHAKGKSVMFLTAVGRSASRNILYQK